MPLYSYTIFKTELLKKIQCFGNMNDQAVKELLNIEETSVDGNNPHPFLS